MKKIIVKLSMATSLMLTNGFSAGIPVIDAVSNAQAMAQNIKTIAEYGEQAMRWEKTITQYKSQLTAYQDELATKIGVRDSVSFFKDLDDFKKYAGKYDDDYFKLGKDMLGSNTMIGYKTKSLFDKYHLFDKCSYDHLAEIEKTNCQNKMVRRVNEVAVYQDYNTHLNTVSSKISDLSTKLTNSADIKESTDIGNALNAQVAQFEITKTKLALMNEQNKRLDEIEKEQRLEQIASNRGKHPDLSNFNFKINN